MEFKDPFRFPNSVSVAQFVDYVMFVESLLASKGVFISSKAVRVFSLITTFDVSEAVSLRNAISLVS